MPEAYHFKTVWHFAVPLPVVWDIITRPLEWPAWWKGVEAVEEIEPGDQGGIEGITRYTWKSLLPYRLSFDMQLKERKELESLKGIAYGELAGSGEWHFDQEDKGGTSVTCIWQVTTEKAWMNIFSFILRPVFSYNHNLVMKWGEKCLRRKLSNMGYAS